MKEEFVAIDASPRKYTWKINPSGPTVWRLSCDLGIEHAKVSMTPLGAFKVVTRNTLYGLEEEFDTIGEATQSVIKKLGLEVLE